MDAGDEMPPAGREVQIRLVAGQTGSVAVYVDPLTNWRWIVQGEEVESCHMVADTDAELHAMARHIGMRLEWAQKMDHENQYHHHYDLVASRRQLAVEAGAIEITHDQIVDLIERDRASKRQGNRTPGA